MLPPEELLKILKGEELLKKYGLVDNEGRLNKPLAFALIDALLQQEATKEELLNYLLKYYKTELSERLGSTLPRIELRWDTEFVKWLTEKKSKPITERTLRDYYNLWHNCLEGKVLNWHLVKQLEGKWMMCKDGKYHPTGWLRQVFRHYVNHLYASGKIDGDTKARLLLIIPGKRYSNKLSQKPIATKDIVRSLRTLDEKGRQDIVTLYLLLISSGIRFMHTLEALKTWSPDEVVYVDYLNRDVKRLECLGIHCRYYIGKEKEVKPAGFMYFPKALLPLILKYKDKLPSRRRIYKVSKKYNCLPPKYFRIYGIRKITSILGENNTT